MTRTQQLQQELQAIYRRTDVTTLIGSKGGHDATYWEILGIAGEGETEYYPSIGADGQEIPYRLGHDAEYWAHKTRRTRRTVRLIVAGNPISAESYCKDLGYRCFAASATTLDIYVD
jgi:hypothetical protein